MKTVVVGLAFLISVVIFVLGCGGREEPAEGSDELAARVEDWTLTREELEDLISKLPRQQKEKYDSPRGRAELAERFLEEELYYREGKRLGIENDDETKKMIDDEIRRIILSRYHKKYVEEAARPTEQEMREYYEENLDKFKTMEVVRARHLFSKSKEKIFEMKKRIDEGEKMTTLTHKFSEDQITREDAGDLGYFNPGGYIRFVGYSQTFSDAVFALEQNVVSDPIKWEKGWSIVVVTEKRPEMLRSFEEARKEIVRAITKARISVVQKNAVEELKSRYEAQNFMEQELALVQREPEELWNFAQTSTDPYERLLSYQEIVQRFPDSDFAPQALFMVGFVYAEELMDFVGADRAFKQVMSKYPDSDVANSAEWMLKNLNKPLPEFKDIDELHEKISEEAKQSE